MLAAPAGIKVDGVPRYDFFANPFEETLRHLFHDPSRAAQLLPTEYGAEVIVRAYHEFTTLARLAWNPYLYDPQAAAAPAARAHADADRLGRERRLPAAGARRGLRGAAAVRDAEACCPQCGHLVPFERADAFAAPRDSISSTRVMQFFYFHLMPWPHLPRDFDRAYDSAWVTLPNRIYDPKRGHKLYNEYLDELEHAERLGFDGLCVNEHHQNAYGTMPSPNLMAAALVRRTCARQARHPRQRHRLARPSAARRRGDRHARRDVGRPHHLRLRARHRLRAPVARRQSRRTRASASTRRTT